MNLKDFSLLKEDTESYTIGHPRGKSMRVSKKGLSTHAQSLISKLKKEQHLAEGGELEEEDTIPINEAAPMPSPEQFNQALASNVPVEHAPSAPPLPSEPVESPPKMSMKQAELQSEIPKETPKEVPPSPRSTPQSLPQDRGEVIQGLQEAKSQIGKEQKQLTQAQQLNETHLKSVPTTDEVFNKYQAKDKLLEDSYHAQQIDPDRYLQKMDTGSRIASSIALVLSGIGAGITGGPNVAQQQINQAIASDIDAQRNDQSKALNLWKMNREAMGNDIQADLATQNQLLTAAKYKMAQAEASTHNAIAQQNLNQAKVGIDSQIATNNWMRSRLSGGAPGTEQQHLAEMSVMQQLRPDLFKDMQSKYLPGIGTTRIPVTEKDKESFGAYDEMQKAVNDAKAFQAEVGTVVPGSSNSARAEGKRQAIALAMNKLNGLNRLNETELHAFQGMIDGIGGFRTGRANAQLDELSNQIQRKKQTEMSALGVVPFKQAASVDQAKVWARQNLNSPDPNIKQKALQISQMVGN